jgi:hypothetical protein
MTEAYQPQYRQIEAGARRHRDPGRVAAAVDAELCAEFGSAG